ncbi:immunity 53 family protein [Streptomyces sp. NPDC050315]|uniref:immunity 53 family protein n=1 Tax=Streptomyces sp. NPDC050315 TaxID=3155039 RepID=UPI00344A0118
MTSPLKALQEWYSSFCDGDWEHSHGVRIETVDNPGWILIVDLERTPLNGRVCDREMSFIDGKWFSVRSDGSQFTAACDPHSLEEMIGFFIEFSQSGDISV